MSSQHAACPSTLTARTQGGVLCRSRKFRALRSSKHPRDRGVDRRRARARRQVSSRTPRGLPTGTSPHPTGRQWRSLCTFPLPRMPVYGDRLWPALVELSSSVRLAVPDMPSRPRMTHRYVSVDMPLGASAHSPTFHGPSALAIQRMKRQNAAEQWTERVFIITDLPAGTVLSHHRLQLDWLQLTSRASLTHVHW